MKASAVRQAATDYTVAQLSEAIEAITDREEEILDVDGEDIGERLTHLMLARRIRERVELGQDMKEAFRAEMGKVRATLQND